MSRSHARMVLQAKPQEPRPAAEAAAPEEAESVLNARWGDFTLGPAGAAAAAIAGPPSKAMLRPLQRKAAGRRHLFPLELAQPAHPAASPRRHDGLRIDQVADPLEQEADRAAGRVASGQDVHGIVADITARGCSRVASAPVAAKAASSDTSTVAPPATGTGQPLNSGTRRTMERQFGVNFDGVRVHTDGRAAASAATLQARAYARGSDLVFNLGEFAPDTPRGKWLLAHELTHVVQQGSGAHTSPTAKSGIPNMTGGALPGPQTERAAAETAASTGVPGISVSPPGDVQRQDTGGQLPAPSPLSTDAIADLRRHAVELSVADQRRLGDEFPDGFSLHDEAIALFAIGGGRANGYRLRGVKVVPPAPLLPGAEAWIFPVEKGRSILVSSTGGAGQSVMLDMGTGGTAGVPVGAAELVQAVERIVGLGLASAPERVVFSHTDADHFNAARAFLQSATFSGTAVQMAQEQLRSTVGQGDWTRMGITLNPQQQLVELEVTGAGGAAARTGPPGAQVHVHKRFYGGFELTEFRSVAAHGALMQPGRRTFDKNSTSPVTIVTDLVTGERMLFTADGTGRLFNEVVDALGEAAFVRMLGGSGGALRTVEYPHHGGRVAGSDASGVLRALRLSFEASDGTMRLVTQTSQRFAGAAGASIRFLDLVGVDVERVTGPTTPTAGASEAVRASGRTLSRVTLDVTSIQSTLTMAQARETDLMQGYQRLHELRALQERVRTMGEAMSMAGAPPALIESVRQTAADLIANDNSLRTAAGRVWSEMENAARAGGGMRASANLTQVNAELARLAAEVTRVEPTRQRNGLDAHEANLNAYGRIFGTMLQMWSALQGERFEELNRLQGKYRAMVVEARAMLGPAETEAHVRGAWERTRAEWTSERLRTVGQQMGSVAAARRTMMTEYRVDLLESLGRQVQLNRLAEQAAHGGRRVYGPDGVAYTPTSTRIGAGILLFIEVLRIGIELSEQIHAANLASEAAASHNRVEGVRTVLWWAEHGATPTLALVKQHWFSGRDIVSDAMSQEAVLAVARGQPATDTPEHDMVVVTDVPERDLLFVIASQYLQATNLEEWSAFNDSNPSGPAFRKFSEGWGVRLWSEDVGYYQWQIKQAIQAPLEALQSSMEAGQERTLSDRAQAAGGTQGLRDTAWVFGHDREAYVFNDYGHMEEIDFDAAQPRFVRGGPHPHFLTDMVVVQAVDMPTYRQLSQYYWTEAGQAYIGGPGGGGRYTSIFPNRLGLALVRQQDLLPPTASSATAGQSGSAGAQP